MDLHLLVDIFLRCLPFVYFLLVYVREGGVSTLFHIIAEYTVVYPMKRLTLFLVHPHHYGSPQ